MHVDESHPDHSITRLIERLKQADPRAADEVWQRYFVQLLPLARAGLRGRADAAVDEDDILVSVFDRFFRAAREDRFARLRDRDDLWQVLLMLTERSMADQFRRTSARKRGGNATSTAAVRDITEIDQLADDEPGPEFVAAFNDSLARAIYRLGQETTREVALLRMEGYENQEIAEQLDISLSSVERKLRVIREVWREEFGE